ncbi:Leucine-rich repeat domain superfamily [Sesbania bispinosa]|nr:Leucine-rich repeat domain superfamily [Sesbania bispinosa]
MGPIRRSKRLEMKRDRISELPNTVLLHIMSFLIIKDAVKTSVLSKRWKDLWKSLPNLKLQFYDFKRTWHFAESVCGILSSRKGDYPLHTLEFDRSAYFPPQIVRNLMKYVASHNIQHLKINVPYNVGLPYCIFKCQSLKSLHISTSRCHVEKRTKIPRHLKLPALVSLHLDHVGISTDKNGHSEPFSSCKILNTLTIDNCFLVYPNSLSIEKLGILTITNDTLTNLIFDNTFVSFSVAHRTILPTPSHKTLISASKLSSFSLNGSPFQTMDEEEMDKFELQSSSLM